MRLRHGWGNCAWSFPAGPVGQHLFARAPEPDACGEITAQDFARRLPAGTSTIVPLFYYRPGSKSDPGAWGMDSYVGTPVLIARSDGTCKAPLVWTPNTLGNPALP